MDNRSGALTRHAGASASTTPGRFLALGTKLVRTPPPRPAPGTMLVAVPALDRIERAALLAQLAGNDTAGVPPSWLVTGIAVQVLASTRLDRASAAAAWDDYLAARTRLDSILAGEPDWDGVLTCTEASAAASACMDALLDGTPAP